MKKQSLTLLLGVISFLAMSQTGPGGIGNSTTNRFWFDANSINSTNGTDVSTWSNQGGNSNDAVQLTASERPTFSTNHINGQSAISFNGVSHELKIDNNSDINLNSSSISSRSYSMVITTGTDITSRQIIWEEGGETRGVNFYIYNGRVYLGAWNKGNSDGVGSPWGFMHSNDTISANTTYILTMVMAGNSSITGKILFFKNEDLVSTINNVGLLYPHNGNNAIGGVNGKSLYESTNNTSGGLNFSGSMSEFLFSNSSINEAERIILHNSLAAKYGISLSSNDIYNHDEVANGNFDTEVVGIGQIDAHSVTVDAQGTGIVRVSNPGNLNNDEFFIFGHNNGLLYFTNDSDKPAAVSSRLDRTWRLKEVNSSSTPVDVGSVDLSFDISDLPPHTITDYRLIVDQNNNGVFTDDTPITGSLNGSTLLFSLSGTDIENGERFTLASISEGDIIWKNGAYNGGSGPSESPNNQDSVKLLSILSPNCVMSTDAFVKNLIVESGNGLSIASGTELSISQDILNDGLITISESAALVQKTNGANGNSGSGSYVVDRSGVQAPASYNIWSSPINNATFTGTFSASNPCDIWAFDANTQSWGYDYAAGYSASCAGNAVTFTASDVLSDGDGVMNNGRGYFIPGAASNNRVFSGEINNGDLTIPIKTTSLGNNPLWDLDDWNLVGNPYPSGLSVTEFFNENAVNNARILGAVYFWDAGDTAAGYHQDDDYATFNLLGGVSSGNSSGNSSLVPNGHISSGQGFWVEATANTNLVFKNSMRSTTNNQFFKTSATQNSAAWVSVETPTGFKNNILVGYNEFSSDSFDHIYDAHKLAGSSKVRFSSLLGVQEYAIQAIKKIEPGQTKSIPLAVWSADSGKHVFSNYLKQNIPSYIHLYIHDKTQNKRHELTTTYSTYLEADTTYNERFELILQHEGDIFNGNITGINNASLSEFQFTQTASEINIYQKNGFSGSLTIVDITGKVVWTAEKLKDIYAKTIPITSFSAGIYHISLTNKSSSVWNKTFVKP